MSDTALLWNDDCVRRFQLRMDSRGIGVAYPRGRLAFKGRANRIGR